MGSYMVERVFTMMLRNTDNTYQILYPKTLAEQIISGDSDVKDHVSDFLTHVWDTERLALNSANRPYGYVQMNDDGYLPISKMDPSTVAINKEYPDIATMLKDSLCPTGTLVMVLDASADPTNKTVDWAVYRREKPAEYWTLTVGWKKIVDNSSLDLNMSWDHITDGPISSGDLINAMVSAAHVHAALDVTNKFSESDDFMAYNAKLIGQAKDDVDIWTGDHERDPDLKPNDFWYKPSIGQSWWFDPSVSIAPISCYELFRDQTSLSESPKLRTGNTNSMRRMFYRCTNLTVLNQYDTRKVTDFTGFLYQCEKLVEVPDFHTYNATTFDNMFYGCKSLLTSPELDFSAANSASGLFSGCESLVKISSMKYTGNIKDMREMFNGCYSLTEVRLIDFSGVTTDNVLLNMFNDCTSLARVGIVKDSLKYSISFANTKLDRDAIVDIFNNLGIVSGKVIDLTGTPGISKISIAERNIAEDKGWKVLPF